jgi:BMFP domain-containing protein YqiC
MVQTTNRFFDEVARLMNDAAGVATGVRREFETLFRTQAERILRDLDVVKRDDFEAVKDMARLAREENEALKARVAALEAAQAAAAANAASVQSSPSYAPQPSSSFDPPPQSSPPYNPQPFNPAPSGGMNETFPGHAPGDSSGPSNPGTF